MSRGVYVLLLVGALPAWAEGAATVNAVSDSRTAWADTNVLAVFNALGLDRNQAAAMLPIVGELHEARAAADRQRGAAEQAELANLQAIHQGLIEGRQLAPPALAILAKLDQAAVDAEVKRADAMLRAYGQVMALLTEEQRRLIRSKDATAADDERAAFAEAIQRQRDFATRRATIQVTLLDLASRARSTPDALRYRQEAPAECLARAAMLTGLSPQDRTTQQLAAQYLAGLDALRGLSPLEFRQQANAIVSSLADTTMYVIVTTQGVGATPTRIPAEKLEEALAYPRTPELLQHLVRERPEMRRGG